MPRKVAGRTESVPSLIVELEKLKEGIRAWMTRPKLGFARLENLLLRDHVDRHGESTTVLP